MPANEKASAASAAFHRSASPRTPAYALLDAARESGGIPAARQSELQYASLFDGEMGDLLKDVAPYLIEFPAQSSFRNWWFEQWGRSVGVLVEAPVGLDELRRHFRTLTVVRDESGKPCYFRFYDPRVLRVFLPACTGEEVRQFFGPITAFHCEAEGGGLLTFKPGADGVVQTQTP